MGIFDSLKGILGGSGGSESRSLKKSKKDPIDGFPVVKVNHPYLYLQNNFDYGENILMWPAGKRDRVMKMFLKDDRVSNLYISNGGHSNYFHSQIYEEFADTINMKTKDNISREIPKLIQKGKINPIDTIYARDFAMTYRFSDKKTKINKESRLSPEALEKCDKDFRQITEAEAKAYHDAGADLVYMDLHDLRPKGERNEKIKQQVKENYEFESMERLKFRQKHYAQIAEIFSEYFRRVHIVKSPSQGHNRRDAIVAQKPK